jgi:hypothetical protein
VATLTPPTLNYLLGDVSNGEQACAGDGQVSISDISLLGAHYGAGLVDGDSLGCLDVGPTTDWSPTGRPLTDSRLQFEDLIIFAMNYASYTPPAELATTGHDVERNELAIEAPSTVQAGDLITARVLLSSTGVVHAVSARLSWDPKVVEPIAVEAGALLRARGGIALSPEPGTLDASVFGRRGGGLPGTGELATVSFRVLAAGDPHIGIASALARDGANHEVKLGLSPGSEPPQIPLRTALGPAFPNPFRNTLSIQFALAHGGPVRLTIYDLAGRRVKTLLNGPQSAGLRIITWDGRDDRGRLLPMSLYLVRFEADGVVGARKVYLVR